MPTSRYTLTLADEEQGRLLDMPNKGQLSAQKLARCRILLRAAEGAFDALLVEALHVSDSTVE